MFNRITGLLKGNSGISSHVIITTSLMALVMSGVLSLYWTSVSPTVEGSGRMFDIILLWLQSWGESFLIAMPMSLIVRPYIALFVVNLKRSEG